MGFNVLPKDPSTCDRGSRCRTADLPIGRQPHPKHVQLTADNVDQTLIPVIQRRTVPIKGSGTPYSRRTPPQDYPRDTVERLLRVHKTHIGELPWTLQDPAEGVELVHCSTARTETTLHLLILRFHNPMDPPLQYPQIDLTREAEACDPSGVGIYSPVPLLKEGDHHPDLPIQRHCPRCPCDAAEACQDSPTTSRALRNSGRTSSTPGALPPRSFLTTSATSAPEMGGSVSELSDSASSERVSVGLRRSSKDSTHRLTTSLVEVSKAPSPPYTVLTMSRFPPPETPDGGPESLRSRPEVVLHGLTELLPGPSFRLSNR